MTGLVFVGDLHRQWHHVRRGLEAPRPRPAAVVLLGDMECHEPLDHLAAPLLDAGVAVHWIAGNHDYDGGPAMWANLADGALNPRTAPGALNGVVRVIGGLRVAGLSGTFRRRVWEPPEPPRLHARAELAADMATLGTDWNEAQRSAMAQALAAMAIWPEDVAALRELRADVLATHEAPSSHPQGFTALEDLARAMGAGLLVHGHHHVGYRARATDGLIVQGVGAGWGVGFDGQAIWPGEPERWLGGFAPGWTAA